MIFDVEKNKLIKLKKQNIKNLILGKKLEKRYTKNSVNLFYIPKKYNKSINIL